MLQTRNSLPPNPNHIPIHLKDVTPAKGSVKHIQVTQETGKNHILAEKEAGIWLSHPN
jgi:hypothetical protein